MAVREEDTTKTPTIYMALDLGHRRWTVGVLLPGDRDARLFQVAGGDREALSELIRRRRQMVGDPGVRVVSCYEAGRDGFWLHRWLRDQDIDNRVLDPASLEAPRRWRRVKTDRVDTLGLLRVLLRLERGETEMTSKVGNRRARTMAIECAWMWTLHQPGSALTRWWQKRFAGGGRRVRRIGIVALARKLMVALWRYLKEDLIPEGAVLA
jgi:transposase